VLHVGLLLALAAAFATNVGFLLRHRGAVTAPDVEPRHPLRSAAGLFRSKWWTIGYGVALVAYGLHVASLALAPMSLVQAVLAAGLVLLAIIAERFFGFELGRREWLGIGLAGVGLAFLAVTGGGKEGEESSRYSLPAMLACEAALVGAGAALILSGRTGRLQDRHGVLLGAAAGFLFTVAHVAVKALSDKTEGGPLAILGSPLLLVALAAWAVAFFASARSLQVGEGVSVIAITSIAGTASSIAAGVVVFGDSMGGSPAAALARATAFLMVVVAGALIPGPTRAAHGPRAAPEPSPA
jgi:drug/metabolite transporter (DMT)-like permease